LRAAFRFIVVGIKRRIEEKAALRPLCGAETRTSGGSLVEFPRRFGAQRHKKRIFEQHTFIYKAETPPLTQENFTRVFSLVSFGVNHPVVFSSK
jgi:hypothetical protein